MDDKNKKKKITSSSSTYQIDKLKERVKELDCLYGLTNIVKDRDLSIDDALQKIIELIPPAWQYPDITCARITIDDKEYKTNNFKETKWSQVSNIILDDQKIGVLGVYYLEEKLQLDEGPFLIEERRLIDAISDLLGKYIGESRISKRHLLSLKLQKKNRIGKL